MSYPTRTPRVPTPMQASFLQGSFSTRYLPSAGATPHIPASQYLTNVWGGGPVLSLVECTTTGSRVVCLAADDRATTNTRIAAVPTGCSPAIPAGQFPVTDWADRSPDSGSKVCSTLDFGR